MSSPAHVEVFAPGPGVAEKIVATERPDKTWHVEIVSPSRAGASQYFSYASPDDIRRFAKAVEINAIEYRFHRPMPLHEHELGESGC